MVTRKKPEASGKKGKVKVGRLQLNKETVKDLSAGDKKQIRGGAKNKTAEGLSGCGSGCKTYCGTQQCCNYTANLTCV